MLTNPVAIVSFFAAVLGLWQLWLRWRAHAIPEVREVAAFMRNLFGDVIAHGELATPKFLTEEVRANELRLGDLQRQVHDRKLGEQLERLMDCWKRTFANAPPAEPMVAYGGGGRPVYASADTPQRREKVKRQVQAARDGQDAVKGVLARCNALERWIVPR